MAKKLNFKGLTIEEIAEILKDGISINVHEASDILNAIERNVALKKKDGFMPNSMWVEAMAQLEGLFEFIEGADGSISSRDIMYVDFNKSQKTSVNEMKKKIAQIKKDIIKLNKRAEKLQGIEEAVEESKKEVDRLRKRVRRKRKSIEGLIDENKIARAEAELKKLEKQLITAKNKATKVATQSDALKDINSQLEYKNNRLATLQESVKEAKATTTNILDENERSIKDLKYDLYEGFTLKRSEYSEGLKKDLAKIDRKIGQAWDSKNEKEVAKLKEQRAKLLEDRVDEITIFEDTYRVTMQSSSKSRLNKSIFIRDKIVNTKTGEIVKQGALKELQSKMTMGLSDIFSKNPDKIIPAVEFEAYSTLTQSSIVDGYIEIKGNNILVVKDVECAVKTKAVVGRQNKDATDILLERIEDYQDKNVLWDGMSLLDKSLFRKDHDMILLRQNFFKSAGFKCDLQEFIKSQCKILGLDYENDCVTDAYGRKVKIADIKMITTNNSTKFDKFAEEMFGEVEDAKKKMFEHWLQSLEKDWDNLFAVVKYDKTTKFQSGNLVRASYQMFNTLPFGTDKDSIEKSMKKILKVTEDYVEELRTNSVAFKEYLENVANNEKADWLLGLMDANADIVNTKQFRDERNAICNKILADARSGHLFLEGNNMTLCSNPVELVKYALGSPDIVVKDGVLDKLASKNSFGKDRDVINIYTTRFKEGEDLVFMRSPHSSASGICVGKNVKNDEIEELFGKKLGENIIIIDSSNHASQSMLNGADFDSDFVLTTDNEEVVRLAKENWGKEYIPVNEVGMEKAQYTILDKAKKDLALGDNTIGEIVNKGQIAKSQLDHLARNKDFYVKKVGLNTYNEQVDGLQYIIDSLTIASNISIDSAKRKYDLDMRAYLKNIDNSKYWLRDEDNKILKPKFFESISQNDKIVTQKLDCNMDLVAEFMTKPSRKKESLKDITELLEDYNTKKVNNRQLNEVLELVSGTNKKITAYRIQINMLEDNDDLYKLIDSEKAKLRKALKKYKLNDDTYKCLLNKVYTDKDFSSCKSLMLDSLMEYDTDKFIGSFVKGASVPSQATLQKLAEDGVIEYLNGNEHLIDGIVDSHNESYKQIKEQVNLIHKDYAEGTITLEEAQGKIDKVITDISKTLRVTVTDGMTERFTKVIEFGYCNNLYNFSKEVGLAVSFDNIPKRAIQSILEKEFAGGKFKDRLYKNIDGVMADELKGILKTGFEEGRTVWTMTQEAKEILGYDVKSCERIVRTESNNFYNQGTLKAYEELGIEKYVFLATLDTRTSKVCASLDLEVFDKDDAEVGKNYPPMHPNCRSTTIMYVDDEWLKSLGRIARNKEGRNINIETMSYQEWYDKFIK